jgi:DNA-binding GntR family transcriptional regulator
MLATIEKQSSEARAIFGIRNAILTGELPLGSRMVEAELAAACGLSRGTIRAALRVLESEGLVTSEPYRGYTVATLTSHDVWEIFTLRNSYESMAAQLVADSINDEKTDRIQSAFEELKKAVQSHDKALIFQSDFSLHRTVVGLSGHQRLCDAYTRLERQANLFYILCNEFLSFDDYITSHTPMLEAIFSGNGQQAHAIASRHNTADGQAAAQKLRALEEARDVSHLKVIGSGVLASWAV